MGPIDSRRLLECACGMGTVDAKPKRPTLATFYVVLSETNSSMYLHHFLRRLNSYSLCRPCIFLFRLIAQRGVRAVGGTQRHPRGHDHPCSRQRGQRCRRSSRRGGGVLSDALKGQDQPPHNTLCFGFAISVTPAMYIALPSTAVW